MPNFAEVYAKARGSKAFLAGLVVFVFGWLGLSAVTGLDADHGLINLFLSTEASISLAFFTMLNDKTDAAQRAQADALERMVSSVLSIAEAQRDMLADHTAILRALHAGDERLLSVLTELTKEQ